MEYIVSEVKHSGLFFFFCSILVQKPFSPNLPSQVLSFELFRLGNSNIGHVLESISQTSKLKAFIMDFFSYAAAEFAVQAFPLIITSPPGQPPLPVSFTCQLFTKLPQKVSTTSVFLISPDCRRSRERTYQIPRKTVRARVMRFF